MDEQAVTSTLSPEQLDEEVAKLEASEKEDKGLTEVTNIAQEEKKTGKKIPLTKEEMKNIAVQDYIAGMAALQNGFRRLSARGVRRLFVAALQLPQEGMKVHLQTNDEKAMFGIAQRILNARTSLILHYIEEAALQAKKERDNKLNEEKVNVKPEQSSESTGINAPESDPNRSSVEANEQGR